MGTELVGDFWLTLLIQPGARSSTPARKLLRCQILTQNRTGHTLALGEEFPRKKITEEAMNGRIAKLYVRCSRCNATAWLSDWMVGAELLSEQRNDRLAQLAATGNMYNAGFLRRCDGTEYLELIGGLVDDTGKEPTE